VPGWGGDAGPLAVAVEDRDELGLAVNGRDGPRADRREAAADDPGGAGEDLVR
jgi:hypothetical protein